MKNINKHIILNKYCNKNSCIYAYQKENKEKYVKKNLTN